jgi:PleD family two-component response regulator
MSVFGVARSTPILVIADEPDSSLETLLLREGAQDFLLKSELDAEPLARRMKHAVERQRYVNSFSMARLADAVAAPRQIALDTVPLDLIVVAEATLVE